MSENENSPGDLLSRFVKLAPAEWGMDIHTVHNTGQTTLQFKKIAPSTDDDEPDFYDERWVIARLSDDRASAEAGVFLLHYGWEKGWRLNKEPFSIRDIVEWIVAHWEAEQCV